MITEVTLAVVKDLNLITGLEPNHSFCYRLKNFLLPFRYRCTAKGAQR
jgi:hypothetical protein